MASEKFLQRDIGRTLVEWRNKRGMTRDEAAWFHGTSVEILKSHEEGTLNFVESATVGGWLADYGAPQAVVDNIKAKAKWIRQGNPANWQESAPQGFTKFTQLEPVAATIDIYEDTWVTGLLQVAGYAEAVLVTNPNLNDEQRRDAVSFRIQRQPAVLDRPGGPPRMRIVLAAEALTRFQDADFYHDQITHLEKIGRLDGVEIFIAPEGTVNPSTGWSYMIMSFDHKRDPDVVYQENLFGARYEADKRLVADCRKLFTATLPVVLPLEEWRASHADE